MHISSVSKKDKKYEWIYILYSMTVTKVKRNARIPGTDRCHFILTKAVPPITVAVAKSVD